METKKLSLLLRYAALAGNILFVLWIAFNAMDEGFKGTLIQKLSGLVLICLLILNSILLIGANRKQKQTN